MEIFGSALTAVVQFLQVGFNLYGFDLSLWQVFLFTGVAGIILYIVFSLWGG